MFEIVSGLIGDDSPFDEAREALVGGCWGTIMSGVFFFFFFFTLIGLLAGGINSSGIAFAIGAGALPFTLLLLVSALLSPFIGILFGVRGGDYRLTRHVGCFGLWLGLLLLGIVVVTVLM